MADDASGADAIKGERRSFPLPVLPLSGVMGLNALNFFTAAIQTGFGPFVSVWLTRQGWTLTDIGVALSLGTGVALIGQIPAGVLVDKLRDKRRVTASALIALAFGSLLLTLPSTPMLVFASEVLHAVASCVITPAIASVTLILYGHARFSQRVGVNTSFSAQGNAIAAAAMGAIAYYSSERMVFVLAALLVVPALIALYRIPPAEHEELVDLPAVARGPELPLAAAWSVFREPALHIFAAATVLFHLANAALLPLALNVMTRKSGDPGFTVSAAIIVPQIIVATLSPWAGKMAQVHGRRLVLLVGFAALPLRAALFASAPGAVHLVMIQVLDGVSAAVFGLMLPLIAADVTKRTGYLNLAIGSLGLAAGIGATLSNVVAGWVADGYGPRAAFCGLAMVGLAAAALLAVAMPETKVESHTGAVTP